MTNSINRCSPQHHDLGHGDATAVRAVIHKHRFIPAFFDQEGGQVYLSCQADGTLSPVHTLTGLPEKLVVSRDAQGNPLSVRATVIAGFVKFGRFLTREQATALVQNLSLE